MSEVLLDRPFAHAQRPYLGARNQRIVFSGLSIQLHPQSKVPKPPSTSGLSYDLLSLM
jgi:hypothetical protein